MIRWIGLCALAVGCSSSNVNDNPGTNGGSGGADSSVGGAGTGGTAGTGAIGATGGSAGPAGTLLVGEETTLASNHRGGRALLDRAPVSKGRDGDLEISNVQRRTIRLVAELGNGAA